MPDPEPHMSSNKPRILVMSHAHPDFSLGGGEIAAYNLFKAYKDSPDVQDAWFLGRADRGRRDDQPSPAAVHCALYAHRADPRQLVWLFETGPIIRKVPP